MAGGTQMDRWTHLLPVGHPGLLVSELLTCDGPWPQYEMQLHETMWLRVLEDEGNGRLVTLSTHSGIMR